MARKFVNIDFKKLPEGQHIIQAPQGCNKTGSLGSLEGESVLLACSRNALLEQIKERLPETIEALHLEDGEYIPKETLKKHKGIGINYSSLPKLSDPKHKEYKPEYLVIDEPILLAHHSTKFKPDIRAESELHYRLLNTPRIIYLGADFPEYLINEIREIARERGDKIYFHETQAEIMEDKTIYTTSSKEGVKTLIRHIVSRKKKLGLEIRLNGSRPKLLFLTDMDEGLERLRERYLQDDYFKDFTSRIITSQTIKDNPEEFEDIKRFGRIEEDILFASPALSVGLRLEGFDITIVSTVGNKTKPQTSNEIIQMMTRDVNCKNIIWHESNLHGLQNKPINWELPAPKYWNDITQKELEDLSEILGKFMPEKKIFLMRNPHTGQFSFANPRIIKRLVESHNWSRKDREYRYKNTQEKALQLGATWHNHEETEKLLPKEQRKTPNYKFNDKRDRLIGKLPHDSDSLKEFDTITQALRLEKNEDQTLTSMELAQYDEGRYLDNEERNKDLWIGVDLSDLEINLIKGAYIDALLYGRLEQTNMKILTDKHFKKTEAYEWLVNNFYAYSSIIKDEYNIYKPAQLDTEFAPIQLVGELLKKWNYYAEFISEKEANPEGKRKKLYQQAKKEHLKEFNRWSRDNKEDGKQIRYDEWIWTMLANYETIKFGKKTKEYIETFPHLRIMDYPKRIKEIEV